MVDNSLSLEGPKVKPNGSEQYESKNVHRTIVASLISNDAISIKLRYGNLPSLLPTGRCYLNRERIFSSRNKREEEADIHSTVLIRTYFQNCHSAIASKMSPEVGRQAGRHLRRGMNAQPLPASCFLLCLLLSDLAAWLLTLFMHAQLRGGQTEKIPPCNYDQKMDRESSSLNSRRQKTSLQQAFQLCRSSRSNKISNQLAREGEYQ